MSHPELSLPATSLRDRTLELVSAVLESHKTAITPWSGGLARTYEWASNKEAGFEPPIKIERAALTANPIYAQKIVAVEATLQIIDSDDLKSVDMDVKVSRQFGSMNDDGWAALILEKFMESYTAHNHEVCELAAQEKLQLVGQRPSQPRPKAIPPTMEPIVTIDRRHKR